MQNQSDRSHGAMHVVRSHMADKVSRVDGQGIGKMSPHCKRNMLAQFKGMVEATTIAISFWLSIAEPLLIPC